MGKAIGILGIVGAVLAALLSSAVSGDLVPILVLLFLLGSSVVLFLQRSTLTTILGIVLILLGLSALLYYNPIAGKDGSEYLPTLPAYFHGAFLPTLAILGVVALLLAARGDVEPAWAGYLGLAAALAAIALVAAVPQGQFGNFANPTGIAAAVLALVLLVPLVAALRSPPPAAAPTAPQGAAAAPPRTARK